jgi:hypothetical protein
MMTYKGKFLQAPQELQELSSEELSSVSRRTVFLLTKKEGVRICPQPIDGKLCPETCLNIKKRQEV